MTNLIDDIKSDFRVFWELPIYQDGHEYSKTGFDALNATLLVERLAEGDSHDDLALVLPDDSSASTMVIIESLLALLQVDMLESDSGFLDNLKPGDSVALFDKTSRIFKPGTFIEMEERNGENWYRVAASQGKQQLFYLIPPANRASRWRVKPYVGDNIGRKHHDTRILGAAIENLLAIDPGDLMANQKSRALLVTGDKAYIKGELSKITLGKAPLTDVFPIADYPNTSSYRTLGHDRLGRRPSLGLVSHVDQAADIALADPSVRLIIVDGAAKIRGGISSVDLLRESMTTSRRVVCLLHPWNEEELGMLTERGMDGWVWSQKDFKKLDLAALKRTTNDSPFHQHELTLKRLATTDTRLTSIRLPSNANRLPTTIRSQIRELVASISHNESAGSLLIRVQTLFRRMMQAPMPFAQLDQFLEAHPDSLNKPFIKQIEGLRRELDEQIGMSIPSNLKMPCAQLFGNIKSLYRALEYENPKLKHITHSLRDGKSTDIVCATAEFAAVLETAIARGGVRVLSSNELMEAQSDKLLLSGWFNPRFAARTFLAAYPVIEYVLYEEELRPYVWVNKMHPAAPNSQIDRKLRARYAPQLVKPIIALSSTAKQPLREDDIETLSAELEKKFGEHLDKELIADGNSHKSVEAVRLVFEDGSRVYAGPGTKLDKLNRSSKSIVQCTYDELTPGDEIVFAASSRSLFQDFVADHISRSDEYQILLKTANIWRNALIEFANRLELTPSDIARKLKGLGVSRSTGSIKAWLEGDIIGPTEDAMDGVKRLTRDPEFSERYADILMACQGIRITHMQAGRSLAKHIMGAIAGSIDGDDLGYDETAAEYARHAHIMLLHSIGDKAINIQSEHLGRLIAN